MYRLSYLQAVEPDALSSVDGILVEVDDELDGMGFPTVDIVAASREEIVEYVRTNWGDDDAAWFREYVVDRIVEAPLDFAEYLARRA